MDIEFSPEDQPRSGGGDFEVLPAGAYEAVVANATMAQMPSGAGLKVAFKITSGDYENRQVFDNYPMSVKWKVAMLLKACGYDTTKTVKNFKASDLVGSPVRVKVIESEWNDKPRNEVRFVDPPPGGAKQKAKTGFSV